MCCCTARSNFAKLKLNIKQYTIKTEPFFSQRLICIGRQIIIFLCQTKIKESENLKNIKKIRCKDFLIRQMIIKVKLNSVVRGQICTCSMQALLRVKFKDTNFTAV